MRGHTVPRCAFVFLLALGTIAPAASASFVPPNDLDETARFFSAVRLMRDGRIGEARDRLDRMLLLDPDGMYAADVALLAGITSLRTGRFDRAEVLLTASLERLPEIGDVVLRYLYELYYAKGDYRRALSMIDALLASYPDTPAARDVQIEVAKCYVHMGHDQQAYRVLRSFLDTHPDHPDLARLTLLAAESLESAGQAGRAVVEYGKVLRDLPFGPETYLAKERFDALFFSGVEKLQSPLWLDEARSWADRLADAGEHASAAETYREILAFMRRNRMDPAEIQRTRYRLAVSLFRSRDYPASLTELDALLGGDDRLDRRDLLFWRARCLIRMGREDDARPILQTLSTGPEKSPLTQRALYHLALVYMETRRYTDAKAPFRRYVDIGDNAISRYRARWYIGWCLFREGRFDEAIAQFERVAARTRGEGLLRIRFWIARAHLAASRPGEAVERLRAIYDDEPFSYYGLQAYQNLRRIGETATPPELLLDPARGERQPLPELDRQALREKDYYPHLLRTWRLLGLGLTDEAARELDPVLEDLGSEPRVRAEVARLLRHAGRVRDSIRLAWTVRSWLSQLRTPPGYDPMRLTFPRGYESIVRREAAKRGLPPSLVWAVMRQESRFDATIRSPAGAMGLMQIMPYTGARLAERLGDADYTPVVLRDPARNVRYGCAYLEFLLDHYDGNAARAVAAYNAGEDAVDRWIANLGELPTDTFVEEIPYSETRNYVREVSRNLTLYGLIYGKR